MFCTRTGHYFKPHAYVAIHLLRTYYASPEATPDHSARSRTEPTLLAIKIRETRLTIIRRCTDERQSLLLRSPNYNSAFFPARILPLAKTENNDTAAAYGVHNNQPPRRRGERPGDPRAPPDGRAKRQAASAQGGLRVHRSGRQRCSVSLAGESLSMIEPARLRVSEA